MPQESTQRPSQRPSGASRSRRRRRKRMNPILYVLIVVAVSAILAGIAWMWAGDVLALNKPAHSAVITLPESIFTTREVTATTEDENGQTETATKTVNIADLGYVSDLLKENGLIKYKTLFKVFCSVTGASKNGKLAPGTYELNTDMDYNALVNAMSARSGSRMTVQVTIPEGYTLDQIFSLLVEKGVSTLDLLQEVSANYDFQYSFLQGVLPLGDYHRLEGYLFPDTYEFYMGGGREAVIQVLNKMILRFDQQFTGELRQQCADMGYSVHDIVTIASLIEKETDGTDQTKISSVIHNRLEHPENETMGYLQVDASIVYVTGRVVTQADYQQVDSPYNTYLNKGLPPGPIASPGMVALNSALHPENTNNYFYMVGDDGLHHFFRTNREFVAFQSTLTGRQDASSDG